MEVSILGCLIYGLLSGFFEFLPASSLAHQYLFSYLSGYSPEYSLIRVCLLIGCISAVVFCCWNRLVHMHRELRLARLPKRRRNRVPDMQAVSSFKLVLIGLIPMALGLIFSHKAYSLFGNLPWISFWSLISGVFLFLPQFLPLGTRDSRNLNRLDGILLGICTALSVIPGISRLSILLYAGRRRHCSREFMLELFFLFCIPMLLGSMLMEVIGMIAVGEVISLMSLLGAICAGVAAFGGGVIAISIMRYTAVKMGFYGFAYYCWGFAVFCFIYYLIT